jgi:hypothetical protein
MDVVTHSSHLARFASSPELEEWSEAVRLELVRRILAAGPSEAAWKSFVELLFFVPEEESIQPIVAMSKDALQRWSWTIRRLDHSDPVLRRSDGVAMALVGLLAIRNLEDLHGNTLRALCDNAHMENLGGLHLHKVETFPEYLGVVGRCPYLTGLESLELTKVDVSGGLKEVFGASRLAGLKSLTLASAGLVSSDIEVLMQAPLGASVEVLSLRGNYINTDDLGLILAADTYPELAELDVSHTSMYPEGLQQMIARRKLPALKKIILRGTLAARSLGDEISF